MLLTCSWIIAGHFDALPLSIVMAGGRYAPACYRFPAQLDFPFPASVVRISRSETPDKLRDTS